MWSSIVSRVKYKVKVFSTYLKKKRKYLYEEMVNKLDKKTAICNFFYMSKNSSIK